MRRSRILGPAFLASVLVGVLSLVVVTGSLEAGGIIVDPDPPPEAPALPATTQEQVLCTSTIIHRS